jgi:hypothetical protein
VNARDPVMEEGERRRTMQAFNDRQVGRMALVGCTEQNRPVIEESYRFVIETLDRHVRNVPFLLGSRPCLGDFGLYGQLQILSIDPTPAAEMRARAPNLFVWLIRLDDASGFEGDWMDRSDPLPETLTALLGHMARTYLPFLAANARAVQDGADKVELAMLGSTWVQAPFRYQAKCYDALCKKWQALPAVAHRHLDPVLEETGCHHYIG